MLRSVRPILRWLWRHAAGAASLALGALVPGVADAQLSATAYRVLGQPDLRQNGVNMVQGAELFGPGGIALDASEGRIRLYVADSRNHRVMVWENARSFQNGGMADLALGQPSLQDFGPLGIGPKGLSNPTGLAVDPRTGKLYVADTGNNRILRFPKPFGESLRAEPDAVYGQADFLGRRANEGGITDHTLNGPRGVAIDSRGNLWVADTGNHRVLRFPAGVLDATNPSADLVIGQDDFTRGTANHGLGRVTASGLDRPIGLAFDTQDNLYVSDFNNNRVLKFPSPQIINQEAKGVLGQSGYTTRTVPAQPGAGTLEGPAGLAMTGGGTLYVAAPNDNRVLAFAGASALPSGAPASAVLGQANFDTKLPNANAAPRASASTLAAPTDVRVDPDGNTFVVDTGNNRVLSYPPNATVANRVWGQPEFTANGVNQVKPSSISAVYKIAIDYSQRPFALYAADTNNHRVLVWRDAVSCQNGAAADLVIGQPDGSSAHPNVDTRRPSRTSLSSPKGIAVDANGALYVADSGNHRVLRFPRPVSQSGRITPDAVIGQPDFTTADSALVSASSLNHPSGLALGPNGNLFVSDSDNHRVLEFTSGSGNGAAAIRVYGQPGFTTGAPPAAASAQTLSRPQGLHVDRAYNLYVTDFGAARVVVFPNTRDAAPTGASASIVIGQNDFNAGAASLFRGPFDVTVDTSGRIYVSDPGSNRILIFPALVFLPISGGAPTGVVGQPNFTSVVLNWNSRDGLATPEGLYAPAGLLLDRMDTLYVGDTGNNRVVHILKQGAPVNGAHFLVNVPVAPGSIVSLFGRDLTGESITAAELPLPRALGGREVVVNENLRAPLLFLSPTQINFQLPSSLSPGTHRVAVRAPETGELVAGGSILVAASSPGLFTLNGEGRGQGIVLNEDGTTNGAASPAARGSVVQIFGTGQGPLDSALVDGEPAPTDQLLRTTAVPTSDGTECLNTQPSVCVAVGTAFGEVLYSGLAPGFVGLWQINVRIPAGIQPGATVPLRVVINATPSNTVTVAVR